jgi:hypothetical protein
MNNVKFAAMVGAVAASTLGVAASHCQSPVSVIPAVIVYRDSALRSGQSSPSSERPAIPQRRLLTDQTI